MAEMVQSQILKSLMPYLCILLAIRGCDLQRCEHRNTERIYDGSIIHRNKMSIDMFIPQKWDIEKAVFTIKKSKHVKDDFEMCFSDYPQEQRYSSIIGWTRVEILFLNNTLFINSSWKLTKIENITLSTYKISISVKSNIEFTIFNCPTDTSQYIWNIPKTYYSRFPELPILFSDKKAVIKFKGNKQFTPIIRLNSVYAWLCNAGENQLYEHNGDEPQCYLSPSIEYTYFLNRSSDSLTETVTFGSNYNDYFILTEGMASESKISQKLSGCPTLYNVAFIGLIMLSGGLIITLICLTFFFVFKLRKHVAQPEQAQDNTYDTSNAVYDSFDNSLTEPFENRDAQLYENVEL